MATIAIIDDDIGGVLSEGELSVVSRDFLYVEIGGSEGKNEAFF